MTIIVRCHVYKLVMIYAAGGRGYELEARAPKEVASGGGSVGSVHVVRNVPFVRICEPVREFPILSGVSERASQAPREHHDILVSLLPPSS